MPRILILAYHFYPSNAVGAKRVSELACRLRDEGWEVVVLTAPPGQAVPELAERIRGIEVITVAPPAKLYPLVTYWPKRFLRGRTGKSRRSREALPQEAKGPSSDSGAQQQPSKTRQESWAAWLKRHYLAMESTVDDRKLWSFLVLLRAFTLRRRFDWIVSSSPVHSVHVAARLLVGATRSRWVMDLRDPWVCTHFWPEQGESASALRDRIERFLERNCAERADHVTVTSPRTGNALRARVPSVADKLQVVLNGYDRRAASSSRRTGRLRLLFAGSLYLNRDPFPLLEALRDLVNRPDVDRSRVGFTLVGQCDRWNGRDVGKWVEEAHMQDVVQVRPAVSPAKVAELMDQSDVMVNFAQWQPDQIPAKFYDYIASGRETLLIAEADSEAARITRESGAGRIVDPQNTASLRTTLFDLYTFYVTRGLSYALDEEIIVRFSREHQNQRFIDLLTVSTARGLASGS